MRTIIAVGLFLLLGGCGSTWSTSNVKNNEGSESSSVSTSAIFSQEIIILESDIPDRKYKILGDIDVTVNKTTIFHSDPTREMVDKKLRQEAIKLGADAVIFVRYGVVGISLMSWGSQNGKGRAIVFSD
jgi:hypothetical protein